MSAHFEGDSFSVSRQSGAFFEKLTRFYNNKEGGASERNKGKCIVHCLVHNGAVRDKERGLLKK